MSNFSPFGSIPVKTKRRTLFDESHELSGNFPLSYCCPVFLTETIPGDSWNINLFNTTKLETLFAPSFQRVNASVLWFKAPKRLLFRHFKKWYSGGEDGQDQHEKPHIYLNRFVYDLHNWITSKNLNDTQTQEIIDKLFGAGSLWQYLGLPIPLYYDTSTGLWMNRPAALFAHDNSKIESSYIDIMPIMFYHMIFDQYFRDQTLSQSAYEDSEEGILKVQQKYNEGVYLDGTYFTFGNVSGKDLSEGGEVGFADFIRLLFMFKRAWKKEYFTSALPTPQRGPEVTIGITEDSAPVEMTGSGAIEFAAVGLRSQPNDEVIAGTNPETDHPATPQDPRFGLQVEGDQGNHYDVAVSSVQGLTADLSGLSPITISAFRNLFKLQAFLEKNNVAGGRYIETILAQWGERVPDFTVQRAQHVRSTSIPVQISEVTATAYSSGLQGQLGDQAGKAKTVGNLGQIHIYTQEPSFILGLYTVTTPPAYAQQGISKMFQRITRFDEPWTDFQHIGEQVIKTRELFYDWNTLTNNEDDFGYQQRFSEFKYMPDRVVGDFATSLAFWHEARMFRSKPALNEQFITQHFDDRIFAVKADRPVIADFYFQATAKRKLSKFSTPKLT